MRNTAMDDLKKGLKTGSASPVQKAYLLRGVKEPGGKLPLFDDKGQRIKAQTIQACLDHGWAEPWYSNPVKPDWLVCRLTELGRNKVAKKINRK